ncbi:hypothetical protein [Phenylobacterium sp.]|uniref:hypothetical protein n=1 Tax=Phenylobacterium sp. TaxID=1871053 RepID=UPI0035AF156F
MALNDAQVVTLSRASVLISRHCGVLSEFELETVANVGARFLRHGREAATTEAEWAVVEASVEAMAQAQTARTGQ